MFFCIGAQKAGTSWLYDLLRQSPDCHFSRNKEVHYFDVMSGIDTGAFDMRIRIIRDMAARLRDEPGPANRHALRTLRDLTDLLAIYTGGGRGPDRHQPYLDYMLAGRQAQPLVCDITPSYATLSRTEYADMATVGQARFLFILRDPVARMWSQIRMATDARKLPPGDFADGCREHAERLLESGRLPRVRRADYARTIAELEAVVPADRIMYVFYEDLFRQETVDALCAFLGIAPVAVNAAERVNEGRSLPIPDDLARTFRRKLARQYDFAQGRFGAAVPAAWRKTAA